MSIQPFKKGPDYIDPSWLTLACGRNCYNLDTFMMPEEMVPASFGRRARTRTSPSSKGPWDSSIPSSRRHRKCCVACPTLTAPVILVVNAERMTRSIAALVSGYQHFEPGTNMAAVILNNVSGGRHRDKLRDAMESHCGIPVVGAVPGDPGAEIVERHLGLIPSGENAQAETVVATICSRVAKHLDLDAIVTMAKRASEHSIPEDGPRSRRTIARIGVIVDRAFSFYYPENLEALSEAGVEVVTLDVLAARQLPDVDGLYIGGGFPELYAHRSWRQTAELRADIGSHREGSSDLCGMCRIDVPLPGDQMAGQTLRDGRVSFRPRWSFPRRPAGHGYVELAVTAENCWFRRGRVLRGHEFHHSRIIPAEPIATACKVKRGHGIEAGWTESSTRTCLPRTCTSTPSGTPNGPALRGPRIGVSEGSKGKAETDRQNSREPAEV